jgi:hypothetical protein
MRPPVDSMPFLECRTGRPHRRIVGFPQSRVRCFVTTDAEFGLCGGASVRLESPPVRPASWGSRATWRWSRGRISFEARLAALERGALASIEIANRHAEARTVVLCASAAVPGAAGVPELSGGVVGTRGGAPLISLFGAGVEMTSRSPGAVRFELRAVVPARDVRTVEIVIHAGGGRVSRRAVVAELAARERAWYQAMDDFASSHLPDERLQRVFERARASLLGAMALDGRGESPYLRPGDPPAVGPATLDAIVLRALDAWGASDVAARCLDSVFAHQGAGAPPGDGFGSAVGYLSAPAGDDRVRDRWGSDCGALLWAASSRFGNELSRAYAKRALPHLEAACRWILRERRAETGVLPPARAPRFLPLAAHGAWNDVWSLRGLTAAAAIVTRIAPARGQLIEASAEEYRRAIGGTWQLDAASHAVLAESDAPQTSPGGGTARRLQRLLRDTGALIETMYLEGIDELNAAASYLLAMRRVFVACGPAGVVHVFPGGTAEWFASGSRLEFCGLPTTFGAVTARSFGAGDRTLVEVMLPRDVRGAVLHVGAASAREFAEVRVNGRRWTARQVAGGAIALPPGSGEHAVDVRWRASR